MIIHCLFLIVSEMVSNHWLIKVLDYVDTLRLALPSSERTLQKREDNRAKWQWNKFDDILSRFAQSVIATARVTYKWTEMQTDRASALSWYVQNIEFSDEIGQTIFCKASWHTTDDKEYKTCLLAISNAFAVHVLLQQFHQSLKQQQQRSLLSAI